MKAIGTHEFDTVLVPLNILDRKPTENLFSLVNELDVGVVIMKSLGGCAGPLEFVQREVRFLRRPERRGEKGIQVRTILQGVRRLHAVP